MTDAHLIEFTTALKNTTYHLAIEFLGPPLCRRKLNVRNRKFHKMPSERAIQRLAYYDRPGGRNGVNGCSDCHGQAHLLRDPVTRLGDVVRDDEAPA